MKFLEEKLEKQYGTKITKEIIEGYQTKRKTTLRINTIKSNIEEIKKELEKEKIEYEIVKWSKEALIIKNADEKTIQEMEIYKNGKIYLQSLSSMLPPIILEQKEKTDELIKNQKTNKSKNQTILKDIDVENNVQNTENAEKKDGV